MDQTADGIPYPTNGDRADLAALFKNFADYLQAQGLTVTGINDPNTPAGGAVMNAATDGAVTAAQNARTGAEAAEAGAVAVATGNLDPANKALIEDPASQTSVALSATYASRQIGIAVAPSGTAAENRAEVQAAIDAAAPLGAPVLLKGAFSIDAALVPASGSIIDGSSASVTMTASLTAFFLVDSKSRVRIVGFNGIGKSTDYANNSGVYSAAGVIVMGTSSNVSIFDCRFVGTAGAGVSILDTADLVRVSGCTLTGPGPTYILDITYNYGAGVRVGTTGRWIVTDCDISEWAQGIVTGDGLSDAHVTDNRIFNIRGQHGAYIESVDRLVFQGNIVRNAGLAGVKVQIGATTAPDPQDITISGNVIDTVGAQGILLTNPPGGAPRLRRVIVSGNVITAAQRGIEANSTIGLHVSDNIISASTAQGISLKKCSEFTVTDVRISGTADEGVLLSACTSGELRDIRMIDPASGNAAGTEFGISVVGACSDLSFFDLTITDAAANMRYGIYSNPTSGQDSFAFRNIRTSGATDYGIRLGASTALREWRNIDASGVLGKVLNLPTSGRGKSGSDYFGSTAPTTGTYVVGDRVWNTAPAASGTVGWVCTAAGTPGTWNTFGAISA